MKIKKLHLKKRIDINFIPEASLDYHKFGLLDNYAIENLLDQFIEESIAYRLNKILVITGKGKVVRPLVKKLLNQRKDIKKHKPASEFNGGEGAIEIFI